MSYSGKPRALLETETDRRSRRASRSRPEAVGRRTEGSGDDEGCESYHSLEEIRGEGEVGKAG